MDFYHILPSHSASSSYPNNNASSYTIPIQPPYILDEKWEVALMNVTHSNCINTFANETVTVYEKFEDYSVLEKYSSPIEVNLSKPKGTEQYEIISEIVNDLKKKSNGMFEIKMLRDKKNEMNSISMHVNTSDYFFIISRKLMKVLQLDTDTFTT